MAKIISIANQKGGVGKTTTTVNLAACLAALSYRTLLVDLDPQGNASSGVGVDPNQLSASIYHVLSDERAVADVILHTEVELLDLLPASADLAASDLELVDRDEREHVLHNVLASLDGAYDYILVDCPPSLSLLTINALVASHSVLVPIQSEYYALEGLARLLDTIRRVQFHQNPGLAIEGMLLTMHDARNNLSRQVESEVREHFGELTYQTIIPRNVRLSESPSHGRPIILYDIESRGARSYLSLAREFVERNMATPPPPAP